VISITNTYMFVLIKKEICILNYFLIFNTIWNVTLIINNLIYSVNREQTL